MLRIAAALIAVSCAYAQGEWKTALRRDHPRLFFNRDTWPAVKARALTEERALFDAMKSRVDRRLGQPLDLADYGTLASETAFVYLVNGDARYLAQAQALLAKSIEYYHDCFARKLPVSNYTFTQINAWAAYDWLFNSLDAETRKRLGAAYLEVVADMQPTQARKIFPRENWGNIRTGFYGTPSLPWYAGLATYGDGIDDVRAAAFVTQGYGLYQQLLEYRRTTAGDDGGSASGALNYALAAYPWAEFNFFHTFRSATGRDIAAAWPYVAYLPGYVFWNWLPEGREFGHGDAYHTENLVAGRIDVAKGSAPLNLHLMQIIQSYAASRPEEASFAKWLAAKTPREAFSVMPYTRFLLTAVADVEAAIKPEARVPLARHFENMGQTFLRSGSGPDDAYAMFVAGGILNVHKHFDSNSFTLYKKGFLALDTGTRPEPGQHLSHYYCRTVAHNAILIHMPGEQMPAYWGDPAPSEERLPVPNDGGQNKQLGSKVIAFETQPEYAYVAGDATPVYSDNKCRQAVRQFLMIAPDFFVVFDRVISTQPDFKKSWLLHTAEEPTLAEGEFSASEGEGRLFCRTLLPEDAQMSKVGGPGKQFWSDGRNWSLPAGYRTPETTPLLGQWRVEISPRQISAADTFLHLIQTGDRSLERMVPSQLIQQGGQQGVRFQIAAGDEWEVRFESSGAIGGHIAHRRNNALVLDRELTRAVMPQAGIYGRSGVKSTDTSPIAPPAPSSRRAN